MRVRLDLITTGDVTEFVRICNTIPYRIDLCNDDNHHVSGKSLLGALYSLEWSEIYCTCEQDVYSKIQKFAKE